MEPHHYSCIKLFTLSLPIFCLLWSWGASSSAVSSAPPPSSSALLAAETLRSRGYSIFASLIVSATSTTNFSGTLLAPPDFAFSFASAKFLNNQRSPPRPSLSLLLYHTIKPPHLLPWSALASRGDGDELRTFYGNNCLFIFRSSSLGGVSISPSPFINPNAAVKIRQPDLYVDDHLTIHGIDGVLDPTFATKCKVSYTDPTVDAVPLQINRVLLDRSIRALKKKGYSVVATAMAIRKSELLTLTSVTVFAVSDENLFLRPDGFRYNFRHHVVPIRHRLADLVKAPPGGMELYSLAPNETVHVVSVDGAVYVDGVVMSMAEVYHNSFIAVFSIMMSLDDVNNYPPSTAGTPAPSTMPIPGVPVDSNLPRVPSPAPEHTSGINHAIPSSAPEHIRSPSPAVDLGGVARNYDPIMVSHSGSPSTVPEIAPAQDSVSPRPPSLGRNDVGDTHCDLNALVSDGIEGGDLLCPLNHVRQQGDTGILSGDDVEGFKPWDAPNQDSDDLAQPKKVKVAENVNIADDVFFYI